MKDNTIIFIALTINHHTLYLSLLRFLIQFFEYITVLTVKENLTILKKSNISDKINFIYESGEMSAILKRRINLINSFDILLIDEFYGKYYKLLNFMFSNKKKICIIHNSNKWVMNKFKINIVHFAVAYIKKRYFEQFDAYITMGPNVKSYLSEFTKKKVFFFPFDNFTENSVKAHKSILKQISIVIPGKVTSERRNYNDLFSFLDNFYFQYPDTAITIKLLGRLSKSKDNEMIWQLVNKINDKYGTRIIYWDSFISTEEFEYELASSDLIMSNLNVINNYRDRVEIYGLTKESGISFSILKYAKPAIIPETQKVLVGFDNQMITFNSYDDLNDIFPKIENGKISIFDLNKKALNNSRNFHHLTIKENKQLAKFLLSEVTGVGLRTI